ELQGKLRTDERGLQRQLVELEVSGAHQRPELVDELVVRLLLLGREVQTFYPGLILDFVELRLRIVFTEDGVPDPAEGDKVRGFAGRIGSLDRSRQAPPLPVTLARLRAPGAIERVVLADGHERSALAENLRKIKLLPLRSELGNRTDFVG